MSAVEDLDEAVRDLRALILAGENYGLASAQMSGLGVTETQALSYLAILGNVARTTSGRTSASVAERRRRWSTGWSVKASLSATRTLMTDGASSCDRPRRVMP